MALNDPSAGAAIAAICTASFLEGTGVPWPGVYIVAGASAMLEPGALSIALVTGLVVAAYCLGSLVQYGIGYLFGETALAWLPARHREKLEALSDRYGSFLVCWSRPFAVGNYVSLPAGLVRMPLLRFLAYTTVGIVPWGAGAALAGQIVGDRIGPYLNRLTEWMLPGTLLLGALALVLVIWKRRAGATVGVRRVCPDDQSDHSGGR